MRWPGSWPSRRTFSRSSWRLETQARPTAARSATLVKRNKIVTFVGIFNYQIVNLVERSVTSPFDGMQELFANLLFYSKCRH